MSNVLNESAENYLETILILSQKLPVVRSVDIANELGFKKSKATIANLGLRAIDWLRKTANEALEQSRHFTPAADIRDLAKMAAPIVSAGNQTGEGWFLTGEMMELIHGGIPNIVCIQPFACLPNHVVGKGVIKSLRRAYPEANIVAVDYDPGASEVNQLNRIKLMLSTARKNLNARPADPQPAAVV